MNKLYLGDCLEIMKGIPDKSVDFICCDLPYGTTQNKWDSVIPFVDLWAAYERIIKDDGIIALNGAQPFSSLLVASNLKLFKYQWIWEKSKASGYLNAKKRPMVAHEEIMIFSKSTPRYNPQMVDGEPYNKGKALRETGSYGGQVATLVKNDSGKRYPRSVQYFKTAESEGKAEHPTQKPLALCEYLIKTYTDEGDLVLDNCMGSGTTCLAAKNLNRQFIGIEKDENYFEIAKKRINP